MADIENNSSGRRRVIYISATVILVAALGVLGGHYASNGRHVLEGAAAAESSSDTGDLDGRESDSGAQNTFPSRVDPLGMQLGNEAAPVVIREFLDYQCPACKHFAPTMKALIHQSDYIDDGQVRVVLFDLPLPMHSNAMAAAQAARCAALQDGFLPMHDSLFAHQGEWANLSDPIPSFRRYANEAGMDGERLERCVKEGKTLEVVRKNRQLAQQLGVRSTPTVVLNNEVVPGNISYEELKERIDQVMGSDLPSIVEGEHRSEQNRERNQYRNPQKTLSFFKVEPDMRVVEIWPAGGWYAEILAPYLAEEGQYIAGVNSLGNWNPFDTTYGEKLKERLESNPTLYGDPEFVELTTEVDSLGPEGSADRVLTFRNVHNWLADGTADSYWKAFYHVLKPGGLLGVVEHRRASDDPIEPGAGDGYVRQDRVIEMVEAAGFELVATSEINANPKDTTDHPEGVWTLPPTLRLGEKDRGKYLEIGESDRMTLKFRKPEGAE